MVELLSRVPYYHQLTLIQDGGFPHFTGKNDTDGLVDDGVKVEPGCESGCKTLL